MDDKKKFVGVANAAIIISMAFVNIAFAKDAMIKGLPDNVKSVVK